MTVSITVIIPTLAQRPMELERAIASVTSQHGVEAIPMVVVNGDRYDQDLLARLRLMPSILCHQIDIAGVSNARFVGRQKVETPYFAFLDDDDELLPGSLESRLDALVRADADVVVTNGYREIDGNRRVIFSRFDDYANDPAVALLEENWLASAGGLFRTATVGEYLLDGLPDFLEMTLLAFLLAQNHTIIRLDRPTFIIHADAANQASQSFRYYAEVPRVLQQMASLTSRRDLRSRLRRRQAAAWHEASERALESGRTLAAWKYHLKSLATGDGLRYLLYTRHIIR